MFLHSITQADDKRYATIRVTCPTCEDEFTVTLLVGEKRHTHRHICDFCQTTFLFAHAPTKSAVKHVFSLSFYGAEVDEFVEDLNIDEASDIEN